MCRDQRSQRIKNEREGTSAQVSRYAVFIQRLCLLINLICWGSSLFPGARPDINPNCDLYPHGVARGAEDEATEVVFP